MFVVDASVWVSWFIPDDVHHGASSNWIETRISEHDYLLAPAIMLPELAGAIARRRGDSEIGRHAVDLLTDIELVRVFTLDKDVALSCAQTASQLRLRGADATYVDLARRYKVPLVTWDDEIRQRAVPLVRVITPGDAV